MTTVYCDNKECVDYFDGGGCGRNNIILTVGVRHTEVLICKSARKKKAPASVETDREQRK